MDKKLWKLFAVFQGIQSHDNNGSEPDPEYKPSESNLDDIIREIFSVDPVSGLPKGDIQYYLSKDGNPDVKRWLENNLLSPRVSSGRSTPEGVTDDMIVEMSRMRDESVEAYSSRLQSIYDECTQSIEAAKQPNPE